MGIMSMQTPSGRLMFHWFSGTPVIIWRIKFRLPQEGQLQEPDVEIELDPYRSYNRSKRSGLSTSK